VVTVVSAVVLVAPMATTPWLFVVFDPTLKITALKITLLKIARLFSYAVVTASS
jgi:hypothetical protein